MHRQTRLELNCQIEDINKARRKLDKIVFDNREWESPKHYDKAYSEASNAVEGAEGEFEDEILYIWKRNKDIAVQKSCNYYLKKAGFKTYKIDAYL